MSLALRITALLTLVFCFAACSLIPSGWRLGGSPLDKNERAQQREQAVQGEAIAGAQQAVHQAEHALTVAPQTRPVLVARQFVARSRGLLDQVKGSPTFADEAAWNDLVDRLMSENAEIREQAERQHAADSKVTGELSQRLANATAAAERANTKALNYARESEDLADFARKLKLGFFGLVGLLVLGTVLSFLARFYPALGLASKVVNGVVAPGITFVAHRAQDGLARVGQGMAKLRSLTANAEDLIERSFDGVTDADHQSLIAAGATAAKPTATPSP